MRWRTEVARAERIIRAEFDEISRQLFADVRIVPKFAFSQDPAWGRYFPDERRIEIYRAAFDQMADPENRTIQLRDVIRHELEHALGEIQPGHFGHEITGAFDIPGWADPGPLTLRCGDIWATLP